VKDIRRLGRWILRLAPFKFRAKHTRGFDNVVADALSPMFEGNAGEIPEVSCAALWQSLPLVYSSLGTHQKEDAYCIDLMNKLHANPESVDSFQVWKEGVALFLPQTREET